MDAQIFIDAAERIFMGYANYACTAICTCSEQSVFPDRFAARETFADWIGPQEGDPLTSVNAWLEEDDDRSSRERRLFALCLMAAVVEAGDA